MQCRLEAHAAPLTKMDEVWAKGVTIKVEESIKLKQFLVGKIRILYPGFKSKGEGEGGVQNDWQTSRLPDLMGVSFLRKKTKGG